MIQELHVLVNGKRMGRVLYESKKARLSFAYDPSWQADPQAYPLSLSMPLTASSHGHAVVQSFLWGLLPDNNEVLRRWGQRFHVSPSNPFKMLAHVGEDCAGAVQLVPPDIAANYLSQTPKGIIEWLNKKELAERIKTLHQDFSATRSGVDTGQFSLAGAQPKTAFYYDPDKDRWGIPSGRTPTTHILKPASNSFDGYAENEHFCLRLARELGLPTAGSSVEYIGDIAVIVVERYDRQRMGKGQIMRIHQEDFCQALGRLPQQKYQNEGGPSTLEMLRLIRECSSNREADEGVFVKSLILNWLIYGTDSHAKNYSILIASGGQIRLAPLYDIASIIPYPTLTSPQKAKLAMKIGGQYLVSRIGQNEWKKFASEHRLEVDWVMEMVMGIARKVPEIASKVEQEMHQQGISNSTIKLLVKSLKARAKECMTAIQ